MKKVIVLGSSGHAKVVIEIIRAMKMFEIVGVTTADTNLKGTFFGVPVLGNDGVLPELRESGVELAAIGVGGYVDNRVRKKVFGAAKNAGFKCLTAIHPTAIVAPSAKIGEGSVIFPGAIIHTETVIGNNVIVATGATVDHETTVHDHVLISAGVHVGANVVIGEESLLAIGSSVITGANIGKNALVAAGGVVVRNVEDHQKVFGVPARPKG